MAPAEYLLLGVIWDLGLLVLQLWASTAGFRAHQQGELAELKETSHNSRMGALGLLHRLTTVRSRYLSEFRGTLEMT